jgi:hypothetical protein
MNENTRNKTDNDKAKTSMILLGETKESLDEIRRAFGYDTLSLAARNAIAVGYGEFKKSPERFIHKLNLSKQN